MIHTSCYYISAWGKQKFQGAIIYSQHHNFSHYPKVNGSLLLIYIDSGWQHQSLPSLSLMFFRSNNCHNHPRAFTCGTTISYRCEHCILFHGAESLALSRVLKVRKRGSCLKAQLFAHTVLSTWYLSSMSFNLQTNMWGSWCYYAHFVDKKAEGLQCRGHKCL